MVRLTGQVLTRRLGRTDGFANDDVVTADPAMGTGTFLHSIIENVATQVTERDGVGAVAGAIADLAKR